MALPESFWRLIRPMRRFHYFLYQTPLRNLMGRIILLLTTVGRKSGQARVTPLQFELVDGDYYVGAARGKKSDWLRNIQANPHVQIQVKSITLSALAVPITDTNRIADFLELRLERHPRMVGAILHTHHLPSHPTRQQLEALAPDLVIVSIHPEQVDP